MPLLPGRRGRVIAWLALLFSVVSLLAWLAAGLILRKVYVQAKPMLGMFALPAVSVAESGAAGASEDLGLSVDWSTGPASAVNMGNSMRCDFVLHTGQRCELPAGHTVPPMHQATDLDTGYVTVR